MTDEQIIKALECCVEDDGGKSGFCNNRCPLFNADTECAKILRKTTLDIITRQKSEIDILIRKKEKLRDEIAEKDAEIERLRKTVKTDFLTVREKLKLSQSDIVEIRNEAIKEFTGKYKEYIKNFTGMFTDGMGFVVNLDAILFAVDFVADNLVKEMVGDDNA